MLGTGEQTMELNAEQIKKALECCKTPLASDCASCSYTGKRLEDGVYEGCVNCLVGDSLALITSQEQRIGELTDENVQFRHEQGKLIEERDTFREYAYKMQKYVEYIKHKEEEGYEPSAARYAAEMDMWRVVALEKKKLEEEVERLQKALNTDISIVRVSRGSGKTAHVREVARIRTDAIRADTVRKMQERLKQECLVDSGWEVFQIGTIDQIAKEMVEGK